MSARRDRTRDLAATARPTAPSLRERLAITLVCASLLLLSRSSGAAWDPLTWYSLDGGGVISPGAGGWSLSGTIGQWDPGTLAAGGYALGGGFWQGGLAGVTGVPDAPVVPGPRFRFLPPTPNPARGTCRLAFELAAPAPTRLVILDVMGRVVRSLDLGLLAAGAHETVWAGDTAGGLPAASGVYFVRLETGAARAVRKLLVTR